MKLKKLLSFLLALTMVLSLIPAASFAEEIEEQTAHEHSFVAGETVEATCTEQGYTVYTCECGDSYTEYSEALGHAWDEGVVTIEPTAETEGEMTYTCTRCGEIQTEAIAVLQPEDPDADPEGEDPEKKDEEDADKEDADKDEESDDPDKKDEDAEKKDEEDSAELKAAEATAPTSMWIAPSELNGLPQGENVRIDLFKRSENSYYELYLPGTASAENFFFSWDGDMQATVTINGQTNTYASGECPVPTPNNNYYSNTGLTYTFKNGTQNVATFTVKAYQGSGSVQKVFIVIDESLGTIQAMDNDKNNTCSGVIYINGEEHILSKMKGRGNATWTSAEDKKPYNITLGSKINFPGISSEKTKKWSFLAEVTDHSLLCNRVGLYLANAMGIGYGTTSADVWMNGEYQGCYTVTPKTDSYVTDDGFMIEQDNYHEPSVANGGDPQFTLTGLTSSIEGSHESSYNCITVKKMGDNLLNGDETASNLEKVATETIKPWLQTAWDAIRSNNGMSAGKYYTDYIDIESFAKMYLLHDYVKSFDVCAGSILFHRDGTTDDYKLIAGPAWDLDNALGATCSDYLRVDRKRGDQDFIENIYEYKTSIYKTIYKYADFKQEVKQQYNLNKSVFDSLPGVVDELKTEISDSAKMNHIKVKDITGQYKNTHKYSQVTTYSTYSQRYEITNNSKTDWEIYVANLRTFVNARTLWFADKYYDPSICVHDYAAEVTTPATCTTEGVTTYTCTKCGDSYTEALPKIAHEYEHGACVVCSTALPAVVISCGEGASVTVSEPQDLNSAVTEGNVTTTYPRSKDSLLVDDSGDGQVNFVVNLAPGYELADVSATGGFKNLKGPDDTGVTNGYRLTKVKGDVEVTVQTQKEPPKFRSYQVVMGGQIGMYFYLAMHEDYAADSYMEFDIAGDKTRVNTTASLKQSDGTYRFLCNLNAIQMADPITATFHYKDNGEDKTIEFSTTVESYLDVLIKNEGGYEAFAKAQESAKALNDYGYYSLLAVEQGTSHTQMTKAYKQPADLISTLSGYPVTFIKGEGVVSVSYSLSLTSETKINLFFETNGLALSKSNTQVSVNDDATFNYTVAKNGDKYQVQIIGINAVELGSVFTISVDGGTTVTASALSYVQQVLTQGGQNVTEEVKHSAAALYSFFDETYKYIKG